jgi:hypothetical protein
MLIGKERMQQEIWFEKYRVIRQLGSGGTAQVYLTEHIKLNSYRVIKFISINHPLYNQLRKEAFLLKDLKHSCIPIIYDIEEDEEGSYIVEQYIEGDTLKAVVRLKGPLQEEMIIHYALQLCDLIHYLHSNERPILYVDLKPENIILSGLKLKLVDFGSAHYADELTTEQIYCGTRGYAAPELYLKGKIDERCDVYGIGMLLYYMVTGCSITNKGTRITNIDHSLVCSKTLKSIINRCLKLHRALRYSSVMQLRRHLSAAKEGYLQRNESSHTYYIAVAGTQARVGVTHFCFRLCIYLLGQKVKCLYREENQSGCIQAIRSCFEDIEEQDELIVLNGIPIQARERVNTEAEVSYRIQVLDYGCLSEENLEQFLAADMQFVVSGAKDWEVIYTEALLNKTAEYKDIIYLFNFLNSRQFTHVLKNMEHKKCFRIPYEPDPFAKITDKTNKELFRELLEDMFDET